MFVVSHNNPLKTTHIMRVSQHGSEYFHAYVVAAIPFFPESDAVANSLCKLCTLGSIEDEHYVNVPECEVAKDLVFHIRQLCGISLDSEPGTCA